MSADIETEAWSAWAWWRKAWAGSPAAGLTHDIARRRTTAWPPVTSRDMGAALEHWATVTGRWLGDEEKGIRFGDFFVGRSRGEGFEVRFGTDFGAPSPYLHDVTTVVVFAQLTRRAQPRPHETTALLAPDIQAARDELAVYADRLQAEGERFGLVLSLWLCVLSDAVNAPTAEMRARMLALPWSGFGPSESQPEARDA